MTCMIYRCEVMLHLKLDHCIQSTKIGQNIIIKMPPTLEFPLNSKCEGSLKVLFIFCIINVRWLLKHD